MQAKRQNCRRDGCLHNRVILLKFLKLKKYINKLITANQMKELTCKKCNEKMTKKGIIQSGNSKSDIYRCNECGNEEMKAIGVIN